MRPERVLLPPMVALLLLASGCADGDDGPDGETGPPPEIVLQVSPGAPFGAVVDTLEARGLVGRPLLFRIYARLRGADRRIRSGTYAFAPGAPWHRIVDDLTAGRIVMETLTIPEGFTVRRIAPRIADVVEAPPDTVLRRLRDPRLADSLDVPGPTLEGYLFPDTYRFGRGTPVRTIVRTMVSRYREIWTPARRARLDSLDMTERELVTLASVVQAEGRVTAEMDTIASVYHNRLREGMRLEADPTVLYALGGHRERLLYAAMDSVAEDPYNTYTHAGLPPGPIGSPGEAAIDATLRPADTDYRYFVARSDGTHVFSRTLAEHNRAVRQTRRERRRMRRRRRGSGRPSRSPARPGRGGKDGDGESEPRPRTAP